MSTVTYTINDCVPALPPLSLAPRWPADPGDIRMGALEGERRGGREEQVRRKLAHLHIET